MASGFSVLTSQQDTQTEACGDSLLEGFVIVTAALLKMAASVSFPSAPNPTVRRLLFPEALPSLYPRDAEREEWSVTVATRSSVGSVGSGQASRLSLHYMETCSECLAGRAEGLPMKPQSHEPIFPLDELRSKTSRDVFRHGKGPREHLSCSQFVSGKRRPGICARVSPYASAPSQTGPRSESSRKLSTLSVT